MTVSKRTRYEVLRRDAHTCRYCKSTTNPLTVDHVVPVSLGGTDKPDNLVAACSDCNAGKAASNPDAAVVAQVSDDALRWVSAMRYAAESLLQDHDRDREYASAFDDLWSEWWYGPDKLPVPRALDWHDTLTRWRSIGVQSEIVLAAAESALGNGLIKPDQTWRYMCGIVWNKVTEMQDLARSQLGSPNVV